VIKVEHPEGGDETRGFEPVVVSERGSESAYFLAFNRTKQSMTLDLRSTEGQVIARRLAAQADVLLENFPVSGLKRYGLDYPSLVAECPRLVYVALTGFGQTGPYAPRKGYDTVFQAMGGIMSLTGEKEGGPVKPGLPIADLSSGLWVAIAVLAALHGRARTQRGCFIDFSMLDGQVALLTLAAARYFALGEVPPRMGTEHPGRVPSAAFRCRDGRWLQITCSDQHWKPLCEALKLEQLAEDPGLATNAGRVGRREEVMARLEPIIAAHGRDELCRLMEKHGVPAGPVLDVAEVLEDVQVRAREMVTGFDHPLIGGFRALAMPFKFDGFDKPRLQRPPLLGEHTDEILTTRLGMTADQIAVLRARRVI